MNPSTPIVCRMTIRNGTHNCVSPVYRYSVKRTVDNSYGHITVCAKEMDRLVSLGAFKVKE